MSKQKWYVVWSGRTPGIYTCWEDCRQHVHGVEGATYKSFKTKAAAEAAYRSPYSSSIQSKSSKKMGLFDSLPYVKNSLCVDAACSGNPGKMEYQGVWTDSKECVFTSPLYPIGTNNIGEFLAIVDALRFLATHHDSETLIYTDSLTAMSWIKKKKVKTSLEKFPETAALWQAIDNAETYLNTHSTTVTICKWDTDNWGEIHADFGRK